MLDQQGWTDEKQTELQTLWESTPRKSAREIAQIFHISRNAVLGKVFRMGLSKRKGANTSKRERAPAARISRLYVRRIRRESIEAPTAIGVGLLQLEEHHCRAIVGRGEDGLAKYCGHAKCIETDAFGRYKIGTDGSPIYHGAFCPWHAQNFYRPPTR